MTALVKYYFFQRYLVYDGTNGADIVTAYNSSAMTNWSAGCVASLTSDTGGTAVIHFTNVEGDGPSSTRDLTMHANDCFVVNDSPALTNTTALATVGTPMTDAGSTSKYGAFGEALLGALSVGSQNITVTIKPTQPDIGYVASAFLDGPSLALGTVSLGTPVNLTGSTVRVPVINSGILPITLSSGTISVHVTAPQP